MSNPLRLSRRTVLKGLGTAVALPWLEAMMPARASAAAAANKPLRMAFIYIPNGVIMEGWTPEQAGSSFKLPSTLRPLEPLQSELLVLSGLAHTKARSNGDGGGDHARSVACFLTGVQAHKTAGADIRNGVSVDQVAAAQIGSRTRLPSLEIGCEQGRQAGSCDSGYSCAYSSNISWRSESTPMPKEIDPRMVFERLFAGGDQAGQSRHLRQEYQQSILDFVTDDAQRLRDKLGQTDRRKLDEYLTAVRELETRVGQAAEETAQVKRDVPDLDVPDGVPKEYGEHMRLMTDLLVLAFQTDTTRIATFMYGNAGSNRTYPFVGVPEPHHYLSHHGNDAKKVAKLRKINEYHARQFAYLLERLKSTPEGDGSLLDNSMIVYGSAIADGNRHSHHDLPIILAGRGGGTLDTGRHLKYASETPLTNLYLAMLERVGVRAEALGDSTGPLVDLA